MVKLKSLRGVDGQKANCTRISGRLFRPQRYSLEKFGEIRFATLFSTDSPRGNFPSGFVIRCIRNHAFAQTAVSGSHARASVTTARQVDLD